VSPMPHSAGFSAAELEAGRRLFAGQWQFTAAIGACNGLSAAAGPEIAFAGRSNVGKSSLINALTGRRALARTSNTPGRTQQLIFFAGPHGLRLVDMPGYGYAAAGKAKSAAWSRLVQAYLRERANLARVYLLVDSRHGLKPADDAILRTLSEAAVSYQLILTKCDEISDAALTECVAAIKAAIAKRPAAFPELIATSARNGQGIAELRAAIARLFAERGSLSLPNRSQRDVQNN
jgi:GTP-binding protein